MSETEAVFVFVVGFVAGFISCVIWAMTAPPDHR
jgi:hypothetical protein